MSGGKQIRIPAPDLQIDFSAALLHFRNAMLMDALGEAVEGVELAQLDGELAAHAPAAALKSLAARGLRGELVFAVPCLLIQNPRLLGYYRLLLGHSQKLFYTSKTGLASFKRLEETGLLSEAHTTRLGELCLELNRAAARLLEGISSSQLNKEHLDDLTLITLGPQLRGGSNNRKGVLATATVFDVILGIVREHADVTTSKAITITNAAGRKVQIHFAADPDIVIREEMEAAQYRDVVAIEVKGGTDFSNIHNRLGEAEKSHQKARYVGFVECWTVVNVSKLDLDMARQESPSTDRFYNLEAISSADGAEYRDFRNRILSAVGVRG